MRKLEQKTPFQRELHMAKAAALKAGGIIMDGFGKAHETWAKADNSLASTVDIAAEESIRKTLTKTFPDYSFWGEESGKAHQESEDLWIVDGLDGSHNYLQGVPLFSVSIAYFKNGEVVAGVIYDPVHDELFSAEKGVGSSRNNNAIRVSAEPVFAHATVGFTRGPAEEDRSLMGRIYDTAGQKVRNTRILGSVGLHFAYVATGRFDALVNIGNHPWDFAAGVLLVSEAGGKVTDLEGSDFGLETNRIIASNNIPTIHESLVGIAKGQALLES